MKHSFLICALCAALCAPVVGYTAEAQAQTETASAQNITLRGKVVDDTGESLPGCAVSVKGTTNGTVTDIDGNFQLVAPANATIVASFVGYSNIEVEVAGRSDLGTLTMESDMTELDQIVVVGYGTQKKADLTGSVSVVDADEMKRSSNYNISTLLQGKSAGVTVTTDGQPGADPSVRIRGIGSFNDTSPLYVVDGVPMGTTIRDFSPNDIETVQILKDASAGAVYGSRAANGVVIITTKRGAKDQPMQISYSGYVGVDNVSDGVYDVMNADQYSDYLGQACANSSTNLPSGYSYNSETGKYEFYDDTDTDWFDAVFKTGVRQNHNINMSGGGANNTYNIALDYFNQKGCIEGAGPNYERYTARINNNMDVKFIKFKTGIVYSHSTQDNVAISNASEYVQGLYGDVTNVLRGTLLMQPTIKAYDESTWVLDDDLNMASSWNYDAYGYGVYNTEIHGDISASNPLLVNNLLTRQTKVDRVVATGSADVDLLDMVHLGNDNHKLHYNVNLSYSHTNCFYYTWISAWVQSNRVYLDKENEKLTEQYTRASTELVENVLNYNGTFADRHHVDLMVGQTFEREKYHSLTAWGNNLAEPYFLQIQNASSRDAETYESTHVLCSYVGRLNYDFDEKYLLSVTMRYDGSSRLSSDDHWGLFPSFSAGWRLDRESWFPVSKDIINLFKIRGSYGELGNENIGDYAYQATLARGDKPYNFGGSTVYGSSVSTFVNTDLAWEKKKSTSIGIDLAMFNNKLEFTAEYYKNKAEDLLYGVPVPTSAGVSNTTVTMNAGTMENSGLEFSATYRNRDRAVKWEVSGNVTTLKNKLKSLGFGTDYYLTGDYMSEVGEELGRFYGYRYEGIFKNQAEIDAHAVQSGANPGDCAYADLNGDGEITSDDREDLGSGIPDLNFGLSARVEWKGLDLSISTFGALGFKVTDDIWNSLHSSYGYANKDVSLAKANQYDADGNYCSKVPRTYASNTASYAWNDLFSKRYIQNANYWKISNIELGYNFKDEWFGGVISAARVYVSAQNLATITGYEGYNVDYAGGTFTPGYNFCSFPTPRTFMAGVHFTF